MKLVKNRSIDTYLCLNDLCPMVRYSNDHNNCQKCPGCNQVSISPRGSYWRLEE